MEEEVKKEITNAFLIEIAKVVGPPKADIEGTLGAINDSMMIAMVASLVNGKPASIIVTFEVEDGVTTGVHVKQDEESYDALVAKSEDEVLQAVLPQLMFKLKRKAESEDKQGFINHLQAQLANGEDKDLEDAVEDAEAGFGQSSGEVAARAEEANTTAAPQEAPAEDKAA